MAGYCMVCGRRLEKSEGPVGPKCLQKIKPRKRRTHRAMTQKQYVKMLKANDIFGEE